MKKKSFGNETTSTHEAPIVRLLELLEEKVRTGPFIIEEGETKKTVLARAELLRVALEHLIPISQKIIAAYRRILSDRGVTVERTGRLGCMVVGGRAHNESNLKSWSDIDLVITAEKPFVPPRKVILPKEVEEMLPEALSYQEYHTVAKALWAELEGSILTEFNQILSRSLRRSVNVVGKEPPDGGLFEIKGYGAQRTEDEPTSILVYEELGSTQAKI